MKSVFEASTGIEAHMIKNLLALNELTSEVYGEHLQGGVGDLQAVGIVRVMVAEDDYHQAREIIAEWEADHPEPSVVDEPGTDQKAGTRGFGSDLLAFIVGAAAMFFILKMPFTSEGIDYNGDGVLDEEYQYAGNYLKSARFDQNRDGKYDAIYKYNQRGLLRTAVFDQDFDGTHETLCGYKEGNTLWCRTDFDDNGDAEIKEQYYHGVLVSADIHDMKSGILHSKLHYRAGNLVRAEQDLDGDGVFESTQYYDAHRYAKTDDAE
ncbi:MAG: DUF2007 domain-containing protein [Pseudomonadota bacterium]